MYQDSHDRTARTGHLRKSGEVDLTEKPEQVDLDRTERTGWSEYDRKNRTARTGQLGQDSHKRTAVTGQSVQITLKVNLDDNT